jgi:HD-GYP domain-containing protein (c-di-GMP phosphodiesterase class II)
MSHEEASANILEEGGTHFDPSLVEVFKDIGYMFL